MLQQTVLVHTLTVTMPALTGAARNHNQHTHICAVTVQATDHYQHTSRPVLLFRYIVTPTIAKAILKHFHIHFIKYLKSMEIPESWLIASFNCSTNQPGLFLLTRVLQTIQTYIDIPWLVPLKPYFKEFFWALTEYVSNQSYGWYLHITQAIHMCWVE